jgi:pseudouridine synthase
LERLQKLLARAGLASRRAAETLILEGRVSVNGQVVCELGSKADPASSEIAVDGLPIRLCGTLHALMLNKPPGVLSTREDDRERPTVMGFVPADLRPFVWPVGRLDLGSTGLILLTNDGPLAFRLTHPSFHVPKRYEVQTSRPLGEAEVAALRTGVELQDGLTAPAGVAVDPKDPCRLAITLREGRKRQIRRMVRAVGAEVVTLHRVAFGPLQLGDLLPGHIRALLPEEIAALRAAAGLEA